MNKTKILIVDDNPEILDVLRILLSGDGYEVILADNGEKALSLLDDSFDLVILDIMMKGISGIKTCEKLRERSNVPVLFLTAKTMEEDKSLGLLVGGDDYLAKPFSHQELLARVKALLRRYRVYKGKNGDTEEKDESISIGDLRISKTVNTVYREEEELNLSQTEYKILLLMTSYPGKIFSAQNLYESIWEEPYFYTSNSTIMVHIHKLRSKLEDDPQKPKRILTVWGKGYRFAQ